MDPLVIQGIKITLGFYAFLLAFVFILIRITSMKRIICTISVGIISATAYIYANRANPMDFLKILHKYAGLLSAVATVIAALTSAAIALWLGHYREKWRRPKLTLCFDPKGREPYLKKNLSFADIPIQFLGQPLSIHIPGFNARLKVINEGRSTARNVVARVEKITLHRTKQPRIIHYHPTRIKWSGEFDWNPVDIVSKSPFFLDLFRVVNKRKEEILAFNHQVYGDEIKKPDLEYLIDDQKIPEDVYWNVWVQKPEKRGLIAKYRHQGDIVIQFTLAAENCKPFKFQAHINWSADKWNEPTIKVVQNGAPVKIC